MINNRMLAVAAVLVMAVPALGAATPIVVPPVPEQLVEGHTVFTVIEIVARTATNESRFAAAVAVLVREFQQEARNQRFPGVLWFNDQYLVNPVQNANRFEAFRYPCGGAVMAVNRGDPDPRVVIAHVNARTTDVEVDNPDPVPDVDTGAFGTTATVGDDTQTYNRPPWQKPYPGTYTYNNDYAWIGADVQGGTVNATNGPSGQGVTLNSDTVVGAIGGSADNGYLNLTGLHPWDYRESYLITDPNDHSWIIDKYEFYTRDGTSGSDNLDNTITKAFTTPPMIDLDGDGIAEYQPSEHWPAGHGHPGGALETEYAYPVWVVNILGSPVFIPDYGTNGLRVGRDYIGENCVPFKDLIESTTAPANGAACGAAIADGEDYDDISPFSHANKGNDTDITLNHYNGVPPWTDNPCMNYQEPSRNGYCYGGQSAAEGCYHGPTGNCNYNRNYRGAGPEAQGCFGGPEYVNTPLRQYNALLYFKLEDLYVWDGSIKDHCNDADGIDTDGDGRMECNPANSVDTNGCSEEQYAWGPNPPQAAYDWQCPAQDDDLEGNSHPFHPTAPPHEEVENCLPAFRSAGGVAPGGRNDNPTNHGGSRYIEPTNRATDDGWYRGPWTPCDYAHTTRDIDIYFSPAGRPFPPPVRYFDVLDLEGSSAPFHDFHSAYPGVNP